MAKLTLAVISDLHIGHGARSKDLSPHFDAKQIDEKYLSTFIEFVRKEHIKANYLIIPGDITERAIPAEFKLASETIVKIAAAMEVPEGKILFVPGNHDKDWNALPLGEVDTTGVRAAQMYASLKNQDWIFERILRQSPYYMLSDPCMAIWDFDDMVVVGYNSAQHDNRDNPIHHGLVTNESLLWLDAKLQTLDLGAQKVKVFLVHHHPVQYSDHIPDVPDFSVMTNAENLLRLLCKFKFDLVVHGHKHMPHFNTQMININLPLAILGAGSFSYQLEISYNGHTGNQFHLLELADRDNESGCICGLLRNWSYLSGHGWKPSEKMHGIGVPHKIGFGMYTTPIMLKNILKPKIQSLLNKHNYAKWIDLVGQDEKLKYLQPEAIETVLREIGRELNVDYWGEKPDVAILLPRET